MGGSMHEDTPPRPEDADLPDGVVRLPVVREIPPGPGGCGLTGCLYGTVAIFAVLLLVMLVVALTRVWMTPVVGR
jgi:hypothetical protein